MRPDLVHISESWFVLLVKKKKKIRESFYCVSRFGKEERLKTEALNCLCAQKL